MAKDQSKYALEAREITKDYYLFGSQKEAFQTIFLGREDVDRVNAIKEMSLDVPAGEIVGVIGHNGAGKSTLLRVLSGVYAPSRGSVCVVGARSGLFEMGGIGSMGLTGREFSQRALGLQGILGKRQKELVEEVKSFSELEENFERKILTYSSGMAARLYFSVATAFEHDVYLIDEALTVGDEHFQAKCWKRIRNRLAGGASGVLVTHDWTAIMRLCKRCYWVDSGLVKMFGKSENIIREYVQMGGVSETVGANFTQLPGFFEMKPEEQLKFTVGLRKDKPKVFFGYSIERLQPGFGWELLILANNIEVSILEPNVELDVFVDCPPLAVGDYYLNLFLTSELNEMGSHVVYEARSWTSGKGVPFKVIGKRSQMVLGEL